MSLGCPRCRTALEVRAQGACTAALCRRCGGTWLGAAATDTVRVALAPQALAIAKEGEQATGDVTLDEDDHCPAHGTWYDLGELEEVAVLLARAQQGEEVAMADHGVPGPKAAWPGQRRGPTIAAANFATREATHEALELDTRGRRVVDDNAGFRLAKAHVPEGGEEVDPLGPMRLGDDAMGRARHIAEICRRNGVDRKTEGRDYSGRQVGDTSLSGVDLLFDVVGSLFG
jgi:Zn-finger nucleic acid-binding protein